MSSRGVRVRDGKYGRAFFRPAVFGRSLPALDPQVDLNPFLVLLNDAVVLAERMSLPAVWKENTFQVGMAREDDPEHIEDFAFQPVSGRPNRNGTGHGFAIAVSGGHPDAFVVRKRVKDPDHIELLVPVRVVGSREIDTIIELLLIAENLQ